MAYAARRLHTIPAISGPRCVKPMLTGLNSVECGQASMCSCAATPLPVSLAREICRAAAVPRPPVIASTSRPSSLRFPLHDFKSFFTLLSEFFSSFDRSTCSLSVSCQYLALREIYLALSAALPSNATRRTCSSTMPVSRASRGFHPPWRRFPDTLKLGRHLTTRLHATTPTLLRKFGFSRWAPPASLAVTEGIIVIFFSSA